MGYSLPFRATSKVWFASATVLPSRRMRSTGFSASTPVISLMMWNISWRDSPRACVSCQPVSCSAAGFIWRTSPRAFVVMTASPML